jgi:hypothetical protein
MNKTGTTEAKKTVKFLGGNGSLVTFKATLDNFDTRKTVEVIHFGIIKEMRSDGIVIQQVRGKNDQTPMAGKEWKVQPSSILSWESDPKPLAKEEEDKVE